VATVAQAHAACVKLRSGAAQPVLDQILAALADHAINLHYKEPADMATKINIFGYTLGSTQPTLEHGACVLRSDLEKAKRAVKNIRGS